jgi:hypothetical protein
MAFISRSAQDYVFAVGTQKMSRENAVHVLRRPPVGIAGLRRDSGIAPQQQKGVSHHAAGTQRLQQRQHRFRKWRLHLRADGPQTHAVFDLLDELRDGKKRENECQQSCRQDTDGYW